MSRKLGFQHAAVWRGVPLAIDRVAFDWEAPDGSRILTAYMGNSYSQGVDLPTERDALVARIASVLQAIAPFHPTADVLLMNGNDHVLPQAALSAAVREATGWLTGTVIRLARLDDYLARLPEHGWPRWRGELRSSARANVLMGTLSVRAPDKQRHFEATRVLERLAEPLAALIPGGSIVSLATATPAAPIRARGTRLENADLVCDLGADGTLAILDRRTGVRYQGLHRLVDSGDAGDEYNFSPPAGNPQPAD